MEFTVVAKVNFRNFKIFLADADEIAMLEPLGVAHNATERLEVAGEDVLVIGCGPVGLLVLMVAKALGAKRCVSNKFG